MNPIMARWGNEFMEEMQDYVAKIEKETELASHQHDRFVQILSFPHLGKPAFFGCHAQFGQDLVGSKPVFGQMAKAMPFRACEPILNAKELEGKIAIVERSNCVFQTKAKHVQMAGAVGMIVIDHEPGSKYSGNKPFFAMAADKELRDEIGIASVFVYRLEGEFLMNALKRKPDLLISLSAQIIPYKNVVEAFFKTGKSLQVSSFPKCMASDGDIFVYDENSPEIIFNMRFNGVNQDSDPRMHQEVVERHVTELQKYLEFGEPSHQFLFYEFFRTAAYGALDLNVKDSKLVDVIKALSTLTKNAVPSSVFARLPGDISTVRCVPKGHNMVCTRLA